MSKSSKTDSTRRSFLKSGGRAVIAAGCLTTLSLEDAFADGNAAGINALLAVCAQKSQVANQDALASASKQRNVIERYKAGNLAEKELQELLDHLVAHAKLTGELAESISRFRTEFAKLRGCH